MTPKKRNSVFGVMMGKGGKPGDPQQSGDGLMSERAEESTASDSNADDLLNDATELGAPIFTMTDDDPDHLLDEPPPSPGHSETVRFMIHNMVRAVHMFSMFCESCVLYSYFQDL